VHRVRRTKSATASSAGTPSPGASAACRQLSVRYGEDLTQSEIGARVSACANAVSRVLRRALQLVQMWAAGHRAS
jgi:hypothetical protein